VDDARHSARQAVQGRDETARGAREAPEDLRLERLLVGDAREGERVLLAEQLPVEDARADLDLAGLLDVGLGGDLRGVDRGFRIAPGDRGVAASR
jgi:hypothetical protein